MMVHTVLDKDAREAAALYALGVMPEDEFSISYEAHLEACSVCREEVDSLRQAVAHISLMPARVAPPTDLRDRLLERVGRMHHSPFTFATAAAATGESLAIEGVQVRVLFTDQDEQRIAMLVRMAAGTVYPQHRHTGHEDCYVIEGDLLVEGVRMGPGDYVRAGAASTHHAISTQNGCLLLIGCHMRDEILPTHSE